MRIGRASLRMHPAEDLLYAVFNLSLLGLRTVIRLPRQECELFGGQFRNYLPSDFIV